MAQIFGITIDGKDGRVLPSSAGRVIDAVFELIRSLDERSWNVNAPRVKWKISDAKVVNPFTLTAEGEEIGNGHDNPQLAITTIEFFKALSSGIRPAGSSARELELAKIVGKELKDSRLLRLFGKSGEKSSEFEVPKGFAKTIRRILNTPKLRTVRYGSVEGTLIQIHNDPLKDGGFARLRERFSGDEIVCDADPTKASEMAKYVNRETRITVYGTVYSDDEIPVRILVEDFAIVPGGNDIPTLEEIRSLRLRPPGGKTVDSYISELRGNE